MKRVFLLVLMSMLLFSSAVSESLTLTRGYYVVGEDINPGGYYIIVSDFGSEKSGWCAIYLDRDKMQEDKSLISGTIPIGAESIHVNLAEGNIVSVRDLPLLFSSEIIQEDSYPKYDPPEGTLVVRGIYRGGMDIPVGVYQVYPAAATAGYIFGYRVEDTYQKDKDSHYHFDCDFSINLFPTKPEKITVVEVEEGNVFIFDVDAILKKQENPVFE